MNDHDSTINAVARRMTDCTSILMVTGAGVSADSGVPTYRGIGGMYEVDVTEEGLPIEQILSGTTLRSNPELTWKYLGQIAEAARGTLPNRAHEVIAEMEQHFDRVWTLTQNVDGFHRMAGSQNVIEIHGNMRSLTCTGCSAHKQIDDRGPIATPPRCGECDSIMRPDVVLFEEMLPESELTKLQRELKTGFSMVMSIGTSSLFPYIQEPVRAARRLGIPTVEINPSETVLSKVVDYRIAGGAAATLDAIWRVFKDS